MNNKLGKVLNNLKFHRYEYMEFGVAVSDSSLLIIPYTPHYNLQESHFALPLRHKAD